MCRPLIDLTNKKFGKLKVLKRHSKYRESPVKWLCLCDCGQKTIVAGEELRRGKSKSCGCSRYEFISKANKRHGMSKTRIFRIWQHMIGRCTTETHKQFEDYGGRGIKICDEWMVFENFRDWAMLNGYEKHLSIDRIDNDGNYEPSNCRWADAYTQQNNTRRTLKITINGITDTLSGWSRKTGIKKDTLATRYYRGIRGEGLISAVKTVQKAQRFISAN